MHINRVKKWMRERKNERKREAQTEQTNLSKHFKTVNSVFSFSVGPFIATETAATVLLKFWNGVNHFECINDRHSTGMALAID